MPLSILQRIWKKEQKCRYEDLRVFGVDWKPELTYATIFAKIQLSSSKREVSAMHHQDSRAQEARPIVVTLVTQFEPWG